MLDKSNDKPKTKKTLMNSFEDLQSKVSQLAEIKELSNRMVRKFQRIDNNDPINKGGDDNIVLTLWQSDIIDLFNYLADDLQNQITDIGNNIEKMLDWID